jgi:hypothetical protein
MILPQDALYSRSISGYVAASQEYDHSHADYLVQEVSEIVVINKLHQHFDLLPVVLKLSPALVESLMMFPICRRPSPA